MTNGQNGRAAGAGLFQLGEPGGSVLPLGADAAGVRLGNDDDPGGRALRIGAAAPVRAWRSLFKSICSRFQIGDFSNAFAFDGPVPIENESFDESGGPQGKLAEPEA